MPLGKGGIARQIQKRLDERRCEAGLHGSNGTFHLRFRCAACENIFAHRTKCMCVRCRQAWYCSKACQRADWSGHKAVCTIVAEEE